MGTLGFGHVAFIIAVIMEVWPNVDAACAMLGPYWVFTGPVVDDNSVTRWGK